MILNVFYFYMVSMTHHHTMQFLDSLHNWNSIMNTFILGQDVVLILLFNVYDFIDVKQ
jgi:hypothetical protein